MSLHLDQVGDTLTLLDRGPTDELSPQEFAFALEVARTRAAPSLAHATSVIDRFEQVVTTHQSLIEQAALSAALLQLPDQAIRLLRKLYSPSCQDGRHSIAFPKIGLLGPGERNTAILFLAPLRYVRARPEFVDLIDTIGLPFSAKLDITDFSSPAGRSCWPWKANSR